MPETDEKLVRVVALFGWRRDAREGILVEISVNELALSGDRDGVELVSNPAKRRTEMWWLATLELPEESVIALDCKVGVRGAGRDTARSMTNRYVVRSDYPVREVHVPKVGFQHFPLLKGPFEIIMEMSEQDATNRKISAALDEIDE